MDSAQIKRGLGLKKSRVGGTSGLGPQENKVMLGRDWELPRAPLGAARESEPLPIRTLSFYKQQRKPL